MASAAVIFAAVVLRIPAAQRLVRFLLNAAWIYIAIMFVLAAYQAYRLWG
jgi:hypothetical protein